MRRTETALNLEEFPAEVASVIHGSPLLDSSCSSDARVTLIERDGGIFLKTAARGTLETEARMTSYLYDLGFSAEVLWYGSHGGQDFLMTRRIPGEDCVFPDYLAEPARLCDTVSGLLRRLHETDASDCPIRNLTEMYTTAVRDRLGTGTAGRDFCKGLWYFASDEEILRTAEEGLPLLRQDTLVHGDYCLPNILMEGWHFTGFVDVGGGGLGDRYMDLFWGIWSLWFNLHTDRWTERFLDGYGRDKADPAMLRRIAAMERVLG